MRKTHFFIPLFVASLLAILAVCCQDDIGISSSTDEAFSLEDAKAFFETGVDELSVGIRPPHGHGKETKSQALELPRLIAPVWTKAERWTERDGNMVVVEIPLYVSNGDRVIRRMWLEGKTKTESLRAYSKLLIRHFKQENVTVSNVVTFIADKRFSGVDKDITELRYDKWKKFSGIVIYTLPDGRFINGYRLVNGGMTHRLFLQDTTIKQASEESDLLMQYDYEDRLGATVPAYNTDTEFYCGTCDYWHPFEEGCEYEYVVNGVSYCRNCELPKTDCICDSPSAVCGECFQNPCVCHGSTVETCSVCHKEPGSCICPKLCGKCGRLGCTGTCDACSNCGARGCDGSCKSTSEKQEDETERKIQRAKKIFRNSHMTYENWLVLGNMLEKIIEDCMGDALYAGLVNHMKGGTIAIQFVEGTTGSFSPLGNGYTGIKLGMQMESNQLLHEMFHVYQSYQTVLSEYNSRVLNLEIEAHYAQYLYIKKLPEYQPSNSKWKLRYSNNPRYSTIRKLKEYINDKGELKNKDKAELLELFMYSVVEPVFRSSGYSETKYPYKEVENLSDNFSNIKKLTKGC